MVIWNIFDLDLWFVVVWDVVNRRFKIHKIRRLVVWFSCRVRVICFSILNIKRVWFDDVFFLRVRWWRLDILVSYLLFNFIFNYYFARYSDYHLVAVSTCIQSMHFCLSFVRIWRPLCIIFRQYLIPHETALFDLFYWNAFTLINFKATHDQLS